MYSGKKAQHDFPKMRGGDQRPFGTFPKIHHFWRCHPSLIFITSSIMMIIIVTSSSYHQCDQYHQPGDNRPAFRRLPFKIGLSTDPCCSLSCCHHSLDPWAGGGVRSFWSKTQTQTHATHTHKHKHTHAKNTQTQTHICKQTNTNWHKLHACALKSLCGIVPSPVCIVMD